MVNFSRIDLDPPNIDITFKKILAGILDSQHSDRALEEATERIQSISNPKITLKFLDYVKKSDPIFATNPLLKDLQQHYYRAFYFYNEPYINIGKSLPFSQKNKLQLWLVGTVASLPGLLALTSAVVFLMMAIPTPLTVIMLVALLPCIVIATTWLVRKATQAFSKSHQTQHEPRIRLGLALSDFTPNLADVLTDDLKSLITDDTLDIREMMGFNPEGTEDVLKKLLALPDDLQSSFQKALVKKFGKEFYAIESQFAIPNKNSWLGFFQQKKQQLSEAIQKNDDAEIVACLSWLQREGFDLSAIQYSDAVKLPHFIKSQLSEKNVGALYAEALSKITSETPVSPYFWEDTLKKISDYLEIRSHLYYVVQNNERHLSPSEQALLTQKLISKLQTQYPSCVLEKMLYEEKDVKGTQVTEQQNILHLILKYYSPEALHELFHSTQPELAFVALKGLLKRKNAVKETPAAPLINILKNNPKLPRIERRKAAAKLNTLLECPDIHPTVHEEMAPTPWVTGFNKKHPKHPLVTNTIPSTICQIDHPDLNAASPQAKRHTMLFC
jgi:hypothetical protein